MGEEDGGFVGTEPASDLGLQAADLIDRVQRLTKTCASKFVPELVRRALR